NFDVQSHLGKTGFDLLVQTLQHTLALEEFQLPPPLVVIGQRIVFRGSMVNLAPIGRPTDELTEEAYRNRDRFVQYDERTAFRRRMLTILNRELVSLREEKDLTIALGGQTSFDIVIAGNDKSYPLRTLLGEGYKRITYIGDALFEGGNDSPVLDFIRKWPLGA